VRILKTFVPALLAIVAAALLLGATSGSASQQTTAPQQAATSVETQAKAKPRTAKYGGTRRCGSRTRTSPRPAMVALR